MKPEARRPRTPGRPMPQHQEPEAPECSEPQVAKFPASESRSPSRGVWTQRDIPDRPDPRVRWIDFEVLWNRPASARASAFRQLRLASAKTRAPANTDFKAFGYAAIIIAKVSGTSESMQRIQQQLPSTTPKAPVMVLRLYCRNAHDALSTPQLSDEEPTTPV